MLIRFYTFLVSTYVKSIFVHASKVSDRRCTHTPHLVIFVTL